MKNSLRYNGFWELSTTAGRDGGFSLTRDLIMTSKTREGLFYGLAAYGIWGLVPLYFRPLAEHVPVTEILANRVVWSLVFLAAILTVAGRWRDLRTCLRNPRVMLALVVSSCLIASNWLVYIVCMASGRIVHASLGYFLTPLVSVLLGMIVFRERPRPLQWVSLALALTGVARLLVEADDVPWLGLTLALSFGFYGLVRKQVPVDGLIGLSVETIVLAPAALAYLAWWYSEGNMTFGTQSRGLDVLIAAGGIVTAVPLLCFGQAARRLSLTSLGFLQYLSPSLQFVLAIAMGEALTTARVTCFAFIWAGLLVFSVDSWRASRPPRSNEILQDG